MEKQISLDAQGGGPNTKGGDSLQRVEKQISLDACQTEHLEGLLRRGAEQVNRTNVPIVLHRQTVEESDGSYEENVATLTYDHVVEQALTSGGPLPPTIGEQRVYCIDEYPAALRRKSRNRFTETVAALEDELG